MRRLGAEDEMKQAWREFLATLPPEERLEGLPEKEILAARSWRNFVATLSLEERLERLPAKEVLATLFAKGALAGLSPEANEILRKELQGDDPTAPAE
jgi:hypothetical protein